MIISVRSATEGDLPRLGEIATVSFWDKTRFSFGKDPKKTAKVFQGFFELDFFSLQHTLVALANDKVVGFCTLKFEERKISIMTFLKMFCRNLGFFGGIRGLLILPWLLVEPFDDRYQVLLQFMCVDDGYRNLGIGTRLLETMYEYALRSNRKEFCSYVIYKNPAKNLYHRVGWHIEPPQYTLQNVTALLYNFRGFHRMIWPLKEATKTGTDVNVS